MKGAALVIFTLIIVYCVFLASHDVFAEDTKSCHCFKNRVYDSKDRFAADDYLLASGFNSLISKKYDIPKKQIVLLKMKDGASHLDLIVASRIFQITGYELQFLLNLRKQKKAWKEILFLPEISTKARKDKLLNELLRGKDITLVGPQIADALISDFYRVSAESVQHLREIGLNEKEMALVFILSQTKNIQPLILAKRHQDGKSWSQIAHELGVSTSHVNELILGYDIVIEEM